MPREIACFEVSPFKSFPLSREGLPWFFQEELMHKMRPPDDILAKLDSICGFTAILYHVRTVVYLTCLRGGIRVYYRLARILCKEDEPSWLSATVCDSSTRSPQKKEAPERFRFGFRWYCEKGSGKSLPSRHPLLLQETTSAFTKRVRDSPS